MINQRKNLRRYVRLCCLLLSILFLLLLPYWIDSSAIFVQSSTFVTISIILTGRALWAGSILGLGFCVISLVRKRFFCRYACPVGLILDTVSRMKLPVRIWWKDCPPIGRYIVLLTAAGAIAGYPLFLWMDPLVFLNNAFSVYKASNTLSVIISLSGMMVLLLLALTSGNFWCARICPLGATQDILEGTGSFFRSFRKQVKADLRVKTLPGITFPSTRRMFITIAAGAGLSMLAKKTGYTRSGETPLRPPGAINENKFTGLCLRCGNCIRACPSGIIHPDTGDAGILGFLAPVVRYQTEYCKEGCTACTKACPSGALQALNPEQKHRYVIGKAMVNRSLCLWGISDCNTCVHSCPFDAVKIYWDEGAYESYPVVDSLKCNGCGACEVYCPTGYIKAIKVWEKTAVSRSTIHPGPVRPG